ncbi:MAG TPA: sodium:solute symporter family protein [Acidobacteriaceae bacterium]|jgi:SSS family solute:Na+ symporter|nr:sodium:solute symporter family protein [Acidobacteriaceae bacterium]
MNVYLIALLVYSMFLMGLGLFISRRVKNSADFLVAGRTLSGGRIFATFLAANIGAGSTVGAAGLGYRFGLSAWWWVGSAAIGSLFLSQFIGPRLWTLANRHGFTTLPEFLQFRYGRAVKLTIAVLFWCGALAILAGQLIAISWILNTIAGIPKWEGCAIGGLVAVVYCTAGGMMSSSFVNMFELAVTMSGLLLALPFAIKGLGGWTHMHYLVTSQATGAVVGSARFSLFGAGARQIAAWVAILAPSFMISPGLLQKVYAARSVRSVRIGVGLNCICQAAFAFVPPLLGLCAFALLPHLANPELALPTAMRTLLPTWLGVWTLASIFSAELSATDAILFMLSSSLAVDFYKPFINPEISPEKLLTVNRISSVASGVCGVLLAMALPSVIAAVTIFYGLLAVALFVPVLAGLYSSRTTSAMALLSIVFALATTLMTMQLTHGRGIGFVSPQLLGISAAAVVTVLSSVIVHGRKQKLPSSAEVPVP